MKNKKNANFVKLIPVLFKQAVHDCKGLYISIVLLNIIFNIVIYLEMKLTQITTNVAYRFISEDNVVFWDLIHPVIIITLVIVFFHVFNLIYNMLELRLDRNLRTQYNFNLNTKLSKMTWESFETHDVNIKIDLIRREGANAYIDLALYFIPWLTSTIIYIITYILIISEMGWGIASIFLLASTIYFIIGIYCGNKVYKAYRNNDDIYKKRTYLYRCTQSKEAHQDSLINRLYYHLSKRWRKLNDEWMNESIKAESVVNIYNIIPNIFFIVIAGFLLYMVVIKIDSHTPGIDIGYFALIISTIISFGQSLGNFSGSLSWYQKSINVYQDYIALMDTKEEIVNNEKRLDDLFSIEFKDVEFTYPQSTYKALNGLNLHIHDHETIAIVGVNGSGKTTFVNILMELSKQYQGDVLVNKDNINNELGILRNSCSCIFQDFLQYQFTIKENIILGDLSREISDEEIWLVLKDVGLDGYVKGLPNGINTILGEIQEGIELSKGQWQRLAVARLLVKKHSKIWILDEPTAYLDPIGEIEMYDFIYSLKGNRTVVFISHRLGFAKRAQRIIVFKDGQVIEDGTHESLMKNFDSEYTKMYEKQRKWYE